MVGVLGATDPDADDTQDFSLVAGDGDADNDRCEIVGTTLKLKDGVAADHEATSQLAVRVQVADAGGLTAVAVLAITVTDVNEAPSAPACVPAALAENVAGASAGVLSAEDPDAGDTRSFSLVSGEGDADNGSFEIAGTTLKLLAGVSADRETKAAYAVRVEVRDHDGLTHAAPLTINVNDVNEAPTGVGPATSSVPENAAGAAACTLTAVDVDAGETFTFALVAGAGAADNARFEIVGAVLKLKPGVMADHEAQDAYAVRVQVSDHGGLTCAVPLTVTVTNVNEAPTAIAPAASAIPENAPGAVACTLTADDADAGDAFTFSLVAGAGAADNASFEIVGTSLKLRPGVAADREAQAGYAVRVQVQDLGGLTYAAALAVSVTDVNEAPTGIASTTGVVAVAENAPGAVACTLTASDVDAGEAFVFSLVDGAGAGDNASFEISGATLRLKSGIAVDHERQQPYSVRIQVQDRGGLVFAAALPVAVTDVNEAPTAIGPESGAVAENDPGAIACTLTVADPDDGDACTFHLVPGVGADDNNSFAIDGAVLRLKSQVAADREAKPAYTVRVQARDAGGLTCVRVLAVSVVNANEAPTAISLDAVRLDENDPGAPAGTLSASDPDAGDTCTFALVEGHADNAGFAIAGAALRLRPGVAADHEAQAGYVLRIRATDVGGLSCEQDVAVTVADVNEPPMSIAVATGESLAECRQGAEAGSLGLVVADPEAGQAHAIEIAGGPDAAWFVIAGGRLVLAADRSLDFEQAAVRSVRLRATDPGGLAVEQDVAVPVRDRDEMPRFAGWHQGLMYYYYADGRQVTPAAMLGSGGVTLVEDAQVPAHYGGCTLVAALGDAGGTGHGDRLGCESYGSAVIRSGDQILVGTVAVATITAAADASLTMVLSDACTGERLVALLRGLVFRTAGGDAGNMAGRQTVLGLTLAGGDADDVATASTLTIQINTSNRPPSITMPELSLGRGETIQLHGRLQAIDDNSAAAALTYLIDLPPAHGELVLTPAGGSPTGLVRGNTFTQADADRVGALSYRHDGGDSVYDAVLFRLRDADGLTSEPLVLQIAINQDNFPPGTEAAGAGALTLLAVPQVPLRGVTVFTDPDALVDGAGALVPDAEGRRDFQLAVEAPAGVDFRILAEEVAAEPSGNGGRIRVPWEVVMPETRNGQTLLLRLTCSDRYLASVSDQLSVRVVAPGVHGLRPRTAPPLTLPAGGVGDAGTVDLVLRFAADAAFVGQVPQAALVGGFPAGSSVSVGAISTEDRHCQACLSLPRAALRPGLYRFGLVLYASAVQNGIVQSAEGWQPMLIRVPEPPPAAAN